MRTTALAVPVVLASALALSACAVSVDDGARDGQATGGTGRPSTSSAHDGGKSSAGPGGASNDAVSDRPVQQSGESASSYAGRSSQYADIDADHDLTYDCAGGPWSSTLDHQVVLLRGRCTDVTVTHAWVEVWVSQADRVSLGTGGNEVTVVANQIGELTIADGWATVYTGGVGAVTVGPEGAADEAEIHTGTIGSPVAIQADWVEISYDQGSPSVTTTGENTSVRQNR